MTLEGDLRVPLFRSLERFSVRTPEPRIFVVVSASGKFVQTTLDQDEAWDIARNLNGWMGELSNVYKPQYLEEVASPELAAEINEALTNPETRTQRGPVLPRHLTQPVVDVQSNLLNDVDPT